MRISPFRMLLLVFALCLAVSARAQADDSLDDRARSHFEAAEAHFDTGAYEDAIREFEEAHRLSGRAQLLYNLYLCHERLGDLNAASDHLARYLDADPEAPNAAALGLRLANLRRRAAAEPRQEPGTVTVSTRAEPVAEAEDSAPAAPQSLGKGKVITFLSLGAAGVLSFGAFAFMASKKDAQLDRSCADACTDHQVSALRTYSLVADISLGIGVTGLVVGSALWWVGRRRVASQAVSISPVAGRHSLSLSAEGRF
jgi:tetratricopeptide (TPR) repeat protein